MVLTFDDAYENFASHALPVLQEHAFPAIVYAISGHLGGCAEWFAKDPGRPRPRLMNAAQLREVRTAGIAIGSHTVNHVKLADVDPATRRREIRQSKRELEDLLGEEVRHFCYPYGSLDADTVEAVRESGYRSATSCLRGAAEPCDDPLLLPRKGISYGDNLLGYFWKLEMKNRPKPGLLEWRRRWAARSR